MNNINRILFITLDRIGDTVRSVFIFRTLKKKFPDAYIACLCTSPSDEILKNDPHIDNVFTLPHSEIRSFLDGKKTILKIAHPVYEFISNLESHKFDLIINPYAEFGAIIMRALKPRYVLGRAMTKELTFSTYGSESAAFYLKMVNIKNIRAAELRPFSMIYSQILNDLDIYLNDEDLFPEIFLSKKDVLFASSFLKENNASDKIVGIQPGAFDKEKRWPVEKYAKLIKFILEKTDCTVLVNGSKVEAALFENTLRQIKSNRIIYAMGKTTLMQATALIKRCSLFISNDTGPMHIASAFNIPIVAFFGHTHTCPAQSVPWGKRNVVFDMPKVEDVEVEAVQNKLLECYGDILLK